MSIKVFNSILSLFNFYAFVFATSTSSLASLRLIFVIIRINLLVLSTLSSRRRCLYSLLQLPQTDLHVFLVLADQLGQIVGDGNVQLLDRAAAEVRAGLVQLLELVQVVQSEESAVDVRIGQVVPGDVRECGQALVNVIVLGIVNDLVRDHLLVAEQSLLVVVGR